eukprot:Skav211347  [mRNA]  locus=scaffold1797:119875:121381:- [translate_table: standard]
MQDLMSLPSWKRHLRTVHPQFIKFKKKVDVCPICHKYDKLVVPKVRKAVLGAMQTVLSVEQTYFEQLEGHWASMVAAKKADPDGQASLQFVRGALSYIEKTQRDRSKTQTPAQLGARKYRMDLREAETNAMNELKSMLSLLEGCEHHFHSFRRQHACREKMEEQLGEDILLVQLDYAENLTLPIGPMEEQSWWWATARLSFSTLGFYCRYTKNGCSCLSHAKNRACTFAAAAMDMLRNSPSLSSFVLHYFGEHHGKGRNDGQFGLQRRWLEAFAARQVISTSEDLFAALREGAEQTMKGDPPPSGPRYDIVHFHPPKPEKFLYLDTSGKDLKIEYTYCLGFHRTKSTQFPVEMFDYTYSDRFGSPENRRRVGLATVLEKTSDNAFWRTSYRKDEPEKDPVPEQLLQRRLNAQKHAKTAITSRQQPEMQKLLAREKQRAQRSEKARRERLQFQPSGSSSSSASDSETGSDA